MANDASYPGGLTYDDWIQYWKCDKAPWISDKLTIDDVVGDVRFAAREIARLTERLEAMQKRLRDIDKAACGEWEMCPSDRCASIRIMCERTTEDV